MKRLTARDQKGNAYFPACFDEPCGGGGCTISDLCIEAAAVIEQLGRKEA